MLHQHNLRFSYFKHFLNLKLMSTCKKWSFFIKIAKSFICDGFQENLHYKSKFENQSLLINNAKRNYL